MPDRLWRCPTCHRAFRRPEQPHACDLARRKDLLREKPATLVRVYLAIEQSLAAWGPHEILTRQRYALFRTTRGFADLVFRRDDLRLAIYLGRKVTQTAFVNVVSLSRNRIVHVALLCTLSDWRRVRPYLKEAYVFARQDALAGGGRHPTTRRPRARRGLTTA
jgi:hypothetical protein